MSYERETHLLRVSSTSSQIADLGLFVTPLREMARRGDPATSKGAAVYVAGRLGRMQRETLSAFTTFGDMTAKEAENLSALSHFGYSSARKRIGELKNRGLLVDTGRREGVPGSIVWSASTLSRAA